MKVLILAAVVTICHAISISDIKDDWLSFKQTHGKKYKNTSEEHYRMKVFLENKKLIDEHNKNYEQGLASFHMKINHFGDLTQEEFKSLMNKYEHSSRRTGGSLFQAPSNVLVPESVDWRQKGAVTPVKDQGSCGACWAFSATGSLEGQHFRKTGKLVSLSEQQLIDCSTENSGCNGGLPYLGFLYVMRNGGLDTEESYPFEAVDGKCRFKKSDIGATAFGFVEMPRGDEEALKIAVATVGPISVSIYAGKHSFQFYSGGVYYDEACSGDILNHGVLVVGYGTENGQDYWLVKNSWNASWGDEGYVKMARNKENYCGIASAPRYPLV